jgi:hypothetical protein
MKRFLFLIFCFFQIFVYACECPPITPISKSTAAGYDVIFYGKVDSIIPCGNEGIGTAFFSIINLFKGSAEQKVSVDYDCTSACMMDFAGKEEWIIYATYQRFDLLTVNICSNSRKKIADEAKDFYQVSSGRTFKEEIEFLNTTLGIQPYSSHNALNDRQKELQPHNELPSATNKLWLLLISLSVMLLVYFISKKFFKNGK